MRRSHLQHRLIAVPDPPPTPAVENMAQRPTVAGLSAGLVGGAALGSCCMDAPRSRLSDTRTVVA